MQKHSYVASTWYYVCLTTCFNDIRFTFDCRKQVNINPGSEPGGGRSSSIKTTKVTLFTVILYNSEKSIRGIKPIYCPLFCHSGVVFISLTVVNPRLRLNHQTLLKSPPPSTTKLTGWIRPCIDHTWILFVFVC